LPLELIQLHRGRVIQLEEADILEHGVYSREKGADYPDPGIGCKRDRGDGGKEGSRNRLGGGAG
jgi:hypothetical protein